MTYGLTCLNDAGELTLSSDCYSLCYLGKASFVSSSDYSGNSTGSNVGQSIWSFTWAGPIVCAIGLKSSGQSGARIIRVSRLSTSSSAWTIVVRDQNTTFTGPSGDSHIYYGQRTDSDVYVFGLPLTANLPSVGFSLYNSSGVLTCDLSKPLLTVKQRVQMATDVTSMAIGSFTKPAIIGYPYGLMSTSAAEAGQYRWTTYDSSWHWLNDGNLYRVDQVSTRSLEDHPGGSVNLHRACSALLIEANGLT